jgi:uncharacterized membrane protein YdjX (TVP38/TMEM64 family)
VRKVVRLTLIIIIAVLIPVVPFLVVGELPGERWLSEADDNALLFAATGTGLLALDIALPIPSSLVGTALGARLGFLPGSFWCWLGLMIGNMVGYGFGQLFPRRLATVLPVEPSQAIIFLSRPVPVFAEVIVMAAGAIRLPLLPFFLSCAAGNAVFAVALCANAALWVSSDWAGPALVFPMVLPLLAWFGWRRLGPQIGSPP